MLAFGSAVAPCKHETRSLRSMHARRPLLTWSSPSNQTPLSAPIFSATDLLTTHPPAHLPTHLSAEGIVDKPADLDVCSVMAMGFPPYRWASVIGVGWLQSAGSRLLRRLLRRSKLHGMGLQSDCLTPRAGRTPPP